MKIVLKGGTGSGNHGHKGVPGKIGGSAPSGGGSGVGNDTIAQELEGMEYASGLKIFRTPETLRDGAQLQRELLAAETPKDVGKVKRAWEKKMDSGQSPLMDGAVKRLVDDRLADLRHMSTASRTTEQARTDRILTMTTSSGKKIPRKMGGKY